MLTIHDVLHRLIEAVPAWTSDEERQAAHDIVSNDAPAAAPYYPPAGPAAAQEAPDPTAGAPAASTPDAGASPADSEEAPQ